MCRDLVAAANYCKCMPDQPIGTILLHQRSSALHHHSSCPHPSTPPVLQVPALHFAAAALRAIIVNVNVNLAPQELAHILADSGADIIVASPDFAPALQAAAAAASAAAKAETAYPAPDAAASASAAVNVCSLCVHAVVWTLPGQPLQTPTLAVASSMPQVSAWSSCAYPYGLYVRTDITGAPVVLSADGAGVTTEEDQALDELSAFGGRVQGDPEDGYQMYYTSGTTGRPKGVLLSHRVVVLHAIGTILGE
jgi:acyl-CoA synthetase (AMP-forming)/AMP-acid ligase II